MEEIRKNADALYSYNGEVKPAGVWIAVLNQDLRSLSYQAVWDYFWAAVNVGRYKAVDP